MSWNYRLCKSVYKGADYEEVTYDIREAYYNKDGGIWAITDNAVGIVGEDIDSVKQSLTWMQLALEKEVIDLDTFVFAKADSLV